MSSEIVTTALDVGTGGSYYVARKAAEKAGIGAVAPKDPVSAGAPPNPEDADTQKKLREAEAQQRRARSRAGTILTGGQGVQPGPSPSAKRTLLST